jgi:undecaprenyl-diphosphatase
MAEFLFSQDLAVFHFVNRTLSNPVLDWLMPFLTDLNKQKIVLWLVAGALAWMILSGKTEIRLAAILLILTVIISDQFNSHIVKFWFARPRPCLTYADVLLRVNCGSGFSFPSSHAVNNFAGAIVLSFFIPRTTPWVYLFASLVAFSRIYVGVHYPLDVLGGAVIGTAVGAIVIGLFLYFESRFKLRKAKRGS